MLTTAHQPPRNIRSLERAYRGDPGNVTAALDLGLAYAVRARHHDALPLLQLAIRTYPKIDAARYHAGIALLEMDRIEEGLSHLQYAFRLNPLYVARFVNEGAALTHGKHAPVRKLLSQWARQFEEARGRGYA